MQNNQLIAVQGAQHPLLMSKHLWVRDMNWIGKAPDDAFHCTIKVRYRSPDVACSVAPHEGGGE